jgi:nucleoid DNA-binding protein
MNKSELVSAIAEKVEGSKVAAEAHLNAIIEIISDELANGGDVTLIGFGVFKVAEKAARTGRNPQTGETIKISARRSPKFTPGKTFKDAINNAKPKKAPAKKK